MSNWVKLMCFIDDNVLMGNEGAYYDRDSESLVKLFEDDNYARLLGMAEQGDDRQRQPEARMPAWPCLPTARVKKIMFLDKEIRKVSAEALNLVTIATTDLFLGSLADQAAGVGAEKKRKTIRLKHLRLVVKRHRPTADFLLDLIPPAVLTETGSRKAEDKANKKGNGERVVPAGVQLLQQCWGRDFRIGLLALILFTVVGMVTSIVISMIRVSTVLLNGVH